MYAGREPHIHAPADPRSRPRANDLSDRDYSRATRGGGGGLPADSPRLHGGRLSDLRTLSNALRQQVHTFAAETHAPFLSHSEVEWPARMRRRLPLPSVCQMLPACQLSTGLAEICLQADAFTDVAQSRADVQQRTPRRLLAMSADLNRQIEQLDEFEREQPLDILDQLEQAYAHGSHLSPREQQQQRQQQRQQGRQRREHSADGQHEPPPKSDGYYGAEEPRRNGGGQDSESFLKRPISREAHARKAANRPTWHGAPNRRIFRMSRGCLDMHVLTALLPPADSASE